MIIPVVVSSCNASFIYGSLVSSVGDGVLFVACRVFVRMSCIVSPLTLILLIVILSF